MADDSTQDDAERHITCDVEDAEQDVSAHGSLEPEETSEVTSSRSEADSDYEDAPSKLEQSQLYQHLNDPQFQESDSQTSEGYLKENIKHSCQEECGDTNIIICRKENVDNDSSHNCAPNIGETLSPGLGDSTIYASASESFLSENGDKEVELKEGDSLSEDDGGDTNDPLGLDEGVGNVEGFDNKEEGEEGEEGELEGDEDIKNATNISAYQTEPVSSDDDLDAVRDNDNQDMYSTRADKSSGFQQSYKVDYKRTGEKITEGVQNGHTTTENDLNHEDHVELDYEEDLDEGDKLRVDSKLEDEKV